MKHSWLIQEAKKWVGVHETSDNRGPVIDQFILKTGGSLGQPWCVSYVRYCALQVDKDFNEIYAVKKELHEKNTLPKTSSVMKLWDLSPEEAKSITPIEGYIACWQHFNSKGNASGLGHCGIVGRVLEEGRWFDSYEGNTGPGNGIERDGDGVFLKMRSCQGSPRFRLMGFVNPWYKLDE